MQRQYDFVTCTEAVEHFYNPKQELERIDGLLKDQGLLVIMTDHRRADREFASWGYRTDSTHVGFFNRHCWNWVAQKMAWQILEYHPRVVIFRKGRRSYSTEAPFQGIKDL